MILDSSAAAAICLGEPDAATFIDHLESADRIQMSAGTYLEAAIVIDARRPGAFDILAAALDLEIVPVTHEQVEVARDAYRRFGRGSGHPAGLNFGDCFAYALAQQSGQPLLCKGEDFNKTDISLVAGG